MITRIEITGFKTFKDFTMEFSPFTIIAGTNASGKSNLFDALRLLSKLAETDLRTAFSEQRGEAIEQFSMFYLNDFAKEISFAVEMLLDKTIRDNWGGKATLKYTRLRYELKIKRENNTRGIEDLFITYEQLTPIRPDKDEWVKKYLPKKVAEVWRPKVKTGKRGKPYIYTVEEKGIITIKLPQDGKKGGKESPANAVAQTVLSGINDVEFPHAFAAKEEMKNWHFLQLNPVDLRKPSPRIASDIITQSGANLASALHRIKMQGEYLLSDISMQLNNLLPNFVQVKVEEDIANNQFVIKLRNEDNREFSSRVLSEGTLRLLALCVLKYDEKYKGILCFEEPENGVHPFRLDMMIKLLKELTTDFLETEEPLLPLRQVIVNTHSPSLIADIFDSNEVSITVWFSQLVSTITEEDTKKRKCQVTKILPVIRGSAQTKLFDNLISEQEKELTKNEAINFLKFKDYETISNKK